MIGSLITSVYASGLSDDVARLPESARTAAEDSIGQANAIAESLPADEGATLAQSAAAAFTDAIGAGFAAAGVFAVVAAVLVRRYLPSSDSSRTPEAEVPAGAALEGSAS